MLAVMFVLHVLAVMFVLHVLAVMFDRAQFA